MKSETFGCGSAIRKPSSADDRVITASVIAPLRPSLAVARSTPSPDLVRPMCDFHATRMARPLALRRARAPRTCARPPAACTARRTAQTALFSLCASLPSHASRCCERDRERNAARQPITVATTHSTRVAQNCSSDAQDRQICAGLTLASLGRVQVHERPPHAGDTHAPAAPRVKATPTATGHRRSRRSSGNPASSSCSAPRRRALGLPLARARRARRSCSSRRSSAARCSPPRLRGAPSTSSSPSVSSRRSPYARRCSCRARRISGATPSTRRPSRSASRTSSRFTASTRRFARSPRSPCSARPRRRRRNRRRAGAGLAAAVLAAAPALYTLADRATCCQVDVRTARRRESRPTAAPPFRVPRACALVVGNGTAAAGSPFDPCDFGAAGGLYLPPCGDEKGRRPRPCERAARPARSECVDEGPAVRRGGLPAGAARPRVVHAARRAALLRRHLWRYLRRVGAGDARRREPRGGPLPAQLPAGRGRNAARSAA